jgi:hypothetical protein
MEIAARAVNLEINLDGCDPGADPECARAMAESVLRELSLTGPCTSRLHPGHPSSVDEKSSAQVSAQSGQPRVAMPSVDRIRLDPDLDFVVHDDGVIELTEAGFRRMVHAHSAGFDAVIGVGKRDVLRLPAPKLGHAPCTRQATEPRCADLIEAHVRRTQPVAELLKAEQSSELASRSSLCCHGTRLGHWIVPTPSVSSGRLQRTANWPGAMNSCGRNSQRRSASTRASARHRRVPWKNCSLRLMLKRSVRRARAFGALAEHRPWRPPRHNEGLRFGFDLYRFRGSPFFDYRPGGLIKPA